MSFVVRSYEDSDVDGWLRCRLLSLFKTDYFDDVVVERPQLTGSALRLVAIEDRRVAGLLDLEVTDDAATIETIAVLPESARRGIATALLEVALVALRARRIHTIDAWTREDSAANAWYLANGFAENHRYLHVQKEADDSEEGFLTPSGLGAPIRALLHAPIEMESDLRCRYRRVYVCRQYLRELR